MKRIGIETVVGFFVILGLVSFAFLAVKLGGAGAVSGDTYSLEARFTSSSGLKTGDSVEVAGVTVGRITKIYLDTEEYESIVVMELPKSIEVQEDAIASIRSSGLIGGKFVKIEPGGSDVVLAAGETIVETEPSVSLEELISKYIFESSGSGE